MGKPAYFVGPWDLNRSLPCVPDNPADGTVVLVESVAKGKALPFHKQKLVLILSAMHHFAQELEQDGFDVEIVPAATYLRGIKNHVRRRESNKLVCMQPREWGLHQSIQQAETENSFGVPVEQHDDGGNQSHFLLTRREFSAWAKGRKQIRMVDFYRWMRKRSGYLMDGDQPVGGKWSFDSANREHARGTSPPTVSFPAPDLLTRQIMARVGEWKGHWGDVEGFSWPVTRQDALAQLDRFFEERAEGFGRFQDAMLKGESFMWHALISAAMNISLISPREVCDRIQEEVEADRMPIAAAEGLLRQILGWREFIRAVYWLRMPQLREVNQLGATRPLPDFFWDPDKTEMTCLRESIGQVRRTGYAHHIQRLMVQGNFALLAGIRPIEISHWFWAGFVDAYEWVELPNVHGMAVYADDTFTTKPYAASGNYIRKMSDYCSSCPYDVKARSGPNACPFNSLFWSFMAQHRDRLENNPRLSMLYRSWDKLAPDEQTAALKTAERFLQTLKPPSEPWRFEDDAC